MKGRFFRCCAEFYPSDKARSLGDHTSGQRQSAALPLPLFWGHPIKKKGIQYKSVFFFFFWIHNIHTSSIHRLLPNVLPYRPKRKNNNAETICKLFGKQPCLWLPSYTSIDERSSWDHFTVDRFPAQWKPAKSAQINCKRGLPKTRQHRSTAFLDIS